MVAVGPGSDGPDAAYLDCPWRRFGTNPQVRLTLGYHDGPEVAAIAAR